MGTPRRLASAASRSSRLHPGGCRGVGSLSLRHIMPGTAGVGRGCASRLQGEHSAPGLRFTGEATPGGRRHRRGTRRPTRAGRPAAPAQPRRALITLVAAVLLVAGAIAFIGHLSDFRISSTSRARGPSLAGRCAAGRSSPTGVHPGLPRPGARPGRPAHGLLDGLPRGGPRVRRDRGRLLRRRAGDRFLGPPPGRGPVHDAAKRILALNTLEWGVLAAAAMICSELSLPASGRRRSA